VRYKLSKNTRKLAFLVWIIIPYIPIALFWSWMSPIGFYQTIIMLLICVFLYVVLLIAELMLVFIVCR